MKRTVPYLLCALFAIPLAIILTFVLSPFWNWFEAFSGIESLGHSGPANWCFAASYVVLVFMFAICHEARTRKA